MGLALGLPLADVARMSCAELGIWRAYRERHGFPADRQMWATVNAGAYAGAVWGGKASPGDLLPRFERPSARKPISAKPEEIEAVKAWFDRRCVANGE